MTRSLKLTCGVIAGLGVLMVGSCAGLLYYGYQTTSAEASPKIDAMFAAIDNGTFADTYDTLTTQAYRDAASPEQHTAIGNAIRVRLGKLKSKALNGFNIKQTNTISYLEVTYDAAFENGRGQILAKLMKEDGEWKFLSFRVESPLFEQALAVVTCPSCGELHTANAKFCPACGVATDASSDDQQTETPDDNNEPIDRV